MALINQLFNEAVNSSSERWNGMQQLLAKLRIKLLTVSIIISRQSIKGLVSFWSMLDLRRAPSPPRCRTRDASGVPVKYYRATSVGICRAIS